MDIKKDDFDIRKDYLSATNAVELFLTQEEKEQLNKFEISLGNYLYKLRPSGRITNDDKQKAIEEISKDNPVGKRVFDKWSKMIKSAVEPENKING